AVTDGCLETHRRLDEVEQLLHALLFEARLLRKLRLRWLTIELLRELPPSTQQTAHLLGDVNGEPDRAALVCQSARHGLPDPPRRVRRKLVAHLVVELLDGADETEVPLLD